MTNIYLQQAAPTVSEKVGEVFSAVVLLLSGALTLLTIAAI